MNKAAIDEDGFERPGYLVSFSRGVSSDYDDEWHAYFDQESAMLKAYELINSLAEEGINMTDLGPLGDGNWGSRSRTNNCFVNVSIYARWTPDSTCGEVWRSKLIKHTVGV